jgi:hypothetical protein
LIHYKNFCKPHNVLLPRITLKRKKRKEVDWLENSRYGAFLGILLYYYLTNIYGEAGLF